MRDHESPIREEFVKSLLRDYYIYMKVTELEEKIQTLEQRWEYGYRSDPRETSKTHSPEEEYEKAKALLAVSEENLQLRKWRQEMDFFKSIKNKLLADKAYNNRFVAIKHKQVIDCDIDKFRLARRINKKYPSEVVLIVKVEIAMRVARVPSPRISL